MREPCEGAAIGSTYTVPVNQSLGPRALSSLFLVISIVDSSCEY
jgi:hypothetical protein